MGGKKEKEKKQRRTVPMVIQGRSFEGKVKRKDVLIYILKNGLKNYDANKSM